jgi:ubiquinone biosynthesis protein
MWTFVRYRLLWAIYRDVLRGHLSNPHCECEADLRITDRARRLRAALESLGPTFVKLGQFVSRRADILPSIYLQQLAPLQEQTQAIPFAAVRRRLEEACICDPRADPDRPKPCLHCRGIEGVFSAFDPDPIASASLAQVHSAVYQGQHVAVKLLKPGVLDRLNVDLSLLESLSWIVGRALGVGRNIPTDELVGEFRRRLLEEVNFEFEALNIERFRDNHPDDGPVRAPRVYWEFERADLLVLEFIDGASLRTWQASVSERKRLARTIAEDFIRQVFIDNFFHADPHPGNVFVQPDGRVVYLDFGAAGQLDPAARRAVLKLFRSIVKDDPDLAVAAVLELGRTDTASVDLLDLRIEVDRIIQLYRRRGGVRWTDHVVQTARRHGIKLPRSILAYAKATMLNEALVNELDPDFEVLPVARSIVLPIIEKEIAELMARVQHEVPDVTKAYAEILVDLPRVIRQWLDRESGTAG